LKNQFLILILSLLSIAVVGQKSDVSNTLLVEQKDGTWILKVRSLRSDFEFQIHHVYGEDSFDSDEKFQELVIDHLLNHLEIKVNGAKPLKLIKGIVKLGEETDVTFGIENMPETIENISVENSSFKDIDQYQSALFIIKKGYKNKLFMLDNRNDHRVLLDSTGYSFERNFEEEQYSFIKDYKFIGALLLSLVFLVYAITRVNRKRKLKT